MKINYGLIVRCIRSMYKWHCVQIFKRRGCDDIKLVARILGVVSVTVSNLWNKKYSDWDANFFLENLPRTEHYRQEYDMLKTVMDEHFDDEDDDLEYDDKKYEKKDLLEEKEKQMTEEELLKSNKEVNKFMRVFAENYIRNNPNYKSIFNQYLD